MDVLPIIDVTGLRNNDLVARRKAAASLGRACRDTGFFYVIGHGIDESLRRAVFDKSKEFFQSPQDVKNRVSVRLSPHNRGYSGFGVEQLDEHGEADHKEAFDMGLELPSDDWEVIAGARFRGHNQWPDLSGWRQTMLDYYAACLSLELDIHRGIAIDLGLDEEHFTPKLARPAAVLRLLRYPSRSPDDGASEFGAGQHTDYGNITILATDGVAGLQVRRRDGVWIDAPHIDGAFVCNIGDCLMRWTNDIYVSTPHRVLRPTAERYSIAFFMEANPDAMVEAIPSCVGPGKTAYYPPVSVGDYLQGRLNATYEHLGKSVAV